MTRLDRRSAILAGALLLLPSAARAGGILPSQAGASTGQLGTVCGVVTGEAGAPEGAALLLMADPGKMEPRFAILIPAANRSEFAGSLGKAYAGKRLCVTGKIRGADGLPPHIAIRGACQVEDNDKTTRTGVPTFGLT